MTNEVKRQIDSKEDTGTDTTDQTDADGPSPDSSTKDSKELKKESNKTNLDKPAWYDPARELYDQGRMDKEELKNQHGEEAFEMLEEMELISGDSSIRLSTDGREVFTTFREQQLSYAKLNVPRIITILAALTAAIVSILSSGLSGGVKISALVIFAIILVVAAVIVEFALKQI
jgi:hypothetical protein